MGDHYELSTDSPCVGCRWARGLLWPDAWNTQCAECSRNRAPRTASEYFKLVTPQYITVAHDHVSVRCESTGCHVQVTLPGVEYPGEVAGVFGMPEQAIRDLPCARE